MFIKHLDVSVARALSQNRAEHLGVVSRPVHGWVAGDLGKCFKCQLAHESFMSMFADPCFNHTSKENAKPTALASGSQLASNCQG